MDPWAEPRVRSIGTDPAAFTQFYRAHVDEVTRFVARRVADPQLAADLTAEVFLAVIEAAARYRRSFGGPRTWLYGIALTSSPPSSAARLASTVRSAWSRDAWLVDADYIGCMAEKFDALRQVRTLHAELQALPGGDIAVLELVSVDRARLSPRRPQSPVARSACRPAHRPGRGSAHQKKKFVSLRPRSPSTAP